MNYCTICDMGFDSMGEHIERYHKPKSETKRIHINKYYKNIETYLGYIPVEEGNDGNILCPLCKVRVGNINRHYYSALHRHNVLKNNIDHKTTLDSMIRHYETLRNEENIKAIHHDKNDPYWITAREHLNERDYQSLKEYIYGEKTNGSHTRNTRLGRFSRASKDK